MRYLWLLLMTARIALSAPVDDFIAAARTKHGEAGAKAARFLVENMPEGDRKTLSAAFLIENLDLAFQAAGTLMTAGRIIIL